MRSYLIVDDNLALGENLAEIIQDAGDSATLAQSGAQALELARVQRFDAVVTDMRMPEMSGADLIGQIAELDSELPVIVVTAFTSDDHLSLARRYGVLGVLPKPIPIEQLLKLVHCARRGGRVAIVEDDEALAENLSEALSDSGFATVVAASLEEAGRIGARPFAAIVDLRLPGGPDGRSASLLRSRYPNLPLLVISGLTVDAAPSEISGFFAKPFQIGEVLTALDRLYVAQGHTNEFVAPS
jgi:DNA-binding response OmpR family regulator